MTTTPDPLRRLVEDGQAKLDRGREIAGAYINASTNAEDLGGQTTSLLIAVMLMAREAQRLNSMPEESFSSIAKRLVSALPALGLALDVADQFKK